MMTYSPDETFSDPMITRVFTPPAAPTGREVIAHVDRDATGLYVSLDLPRSTALEPAEARQLATEMAVIVEYLDQAGR